jgi:hypothetical protein
MASGVIGMGAGPGGMVGSRISLGAGVGGGAGTSGTSGLSSFEEGWGFRVCLKKWPMSCDEGRPHAENRADRSAIVRPTLRVRLRVRETGSGFGHGRLAPAAVPV